MQMPIVVFNTTLPPSIKTTTISQSVVMNFPALALVLTFELLILKW